MSGLSTQPLNPELYQRLTTVFGKVAVAHPGMAAVPRLENAVAGGKIVLRPAGEYYRVSCPFCKETHKQRLWINHLWGHGCEARPEDPLWWAAICYNAACLSVPGNRRLLRDMIYKQIGRAQRYSMPIYPGKIVSAPSGPVDDPGVCIPLDQLTADHRAVTYVQQRGFDANALARDYGVTYCDSALPAFRHAAGRLVMPITMDGVQYSWQARFIGEADWRFVPKYYNCPVSKSALLYGFDAAKPLPFVIICEGVTDVWAVGPGAVAVLGKTLTYQQGELIKKHWPVAIILLDAEARDEAADVLDRLRGAMSVVVVSLPPGTDPAIVEKEYLWDLIDGTARAQGVDLLQLPYTR